jgi:hypothetical protein
VRRRRHLETGAALETLPQNAQRILSHSIRAVSAWHKNADPDSSRLEPDRKRLNAL